MSRPIYVRRHTAHEITSGLECALMNTPDAFIATKITNTHMDPEERVYMYVRLR